MADPPTVMKRRLIAGVLWASVVSLPAACILEQSSGGAAAGGIGVVGANGDDSGAPDSSDEASDEASVAGVDAETDGDVDAGGGGQGDGGGGQGDGGGADGTALHCSALPFGCVCSPTEPSQVGACNTGSVIAMPGQRGVCCNNPYNCICVAYECVRVNGSTCDCGLAAATLEGTRVADCGTVSANPAIKCCRSYGQCVCSTTDCVPIAEAQVSGCSVEDLLTCDVGNDSVSACEQAGGQPGG